MNIHLFRTEGYSINDYHDVCNLLNSNSGVMRFISHEETVSTGEGSKSEQDPMIAVSEMRLPPLQSEKEYKEQFWEERNLSWQEIFDCTEKLRSDFDLGDDEFVVLLTEKNNTQNWFAGGSPRGKKDLFVQTAYWDFFVGSDQRYPVVYHIATVILKMHIFRDFGDLDKYWHKKPRGCFMDFCENKTDIHLKLRTGDICNDCIQLITERNVNTLLINQVFTMIDSIRSQMSFKQRYIMQRQDPTMTVSGYMYKLMFHSLGNLEIRLTPLEKCLYIFFLKHPEGVPLSHLPDYKEEIFQIYQRISNSSDIEQMKRSIDDLTDPIFDSVSQKLSKIKKKLKDALGEEMSLPFIIDGKPGEKRFVQAAGKVVWEE